MSVQLRRVLIFVALVYRRACVEPALELYQLQTLKMLETLTTTSHDHSILRHFDDFVLLAEQKMRKKIKIRTKPLHLYNWMRFKKIKTEFFSNETYQTKLCLTMYDNIQITMNHIGGIFNVSGTIVIGQVIESRVCLSSYERYEYGFVNECWKFITETDFIFARFLKFKIQFFNGE